MPMPRCSLGCCFQNFALGVRAQANTLCQLRTVNSSLGKIGAADKRCKETVDHFLFRCGKWALLTKLES